MKAKQVELSIIEIINKHASLQKAFKYVFFNNKNNYAPYHNLNHLLTVTKHVYFGLEFENLLNTKNAKELLLAAMFHDVNHSLGQKTDAENIAVAKKSLLNFIRKEKIFADVAFMFSAIEATEYPYTVLSKDLDVFHKIIRDADMMQLFELNWIQQSILGISKEQNISLSKFIKGQQKFLASVKFSSAYGKQMKKLKWAQLKKEIQLLEKIVVPQ